MIKIDSTNLTKVKRVHGLSLNDLRADAAKIKNLLKKIESRKQGFYKVIDDTTVIGKIGAYAKKHRYSHKNIVVLGIGGSALGTICLQQSLKHLFHNELDSSSRYPRLHVLDNIDPALMTEICDVIDIKTTLFIVITKSGTTPETLSQYFFFMEKVKAKRLNPKDHFVFITGHGKSLLRKISRETDIPIFDIPENVGGRFSVLTAVGLLPAALMGINIKKLVEGAREMRKSFLNTNSSRNLPFLLAASQFRLLNKGKTINVMMPYSQKLIRFADWYSQLLAESIGKKGIGITPVSALGVTDQHSQNQLYNEGPNDKLFIFIKLAGPGPKLSIKAPGDNRETAYMKNLTFGKLMDTEMLGTIGALTENDRPNLTVEIDQIDEFHLGGLFMLFEAATAFLGEMLDINAYDQPGVERSKQITKKLLTKN
jgi:glucose-6-phosphate isomerase